MGTDAIQRESTILITGAQGFIGRNLAFGLVHRGYTNLLRFDRENTDAELAEMCAKADFVFHLAGVNRPRDPKEFYDGNTDLTARLCALLAAFPPPKREEAPARRRLRIAVSRERAPRRLLFGLLLLLMYLLLGNPLYLGAALLTLFLAAMGWKKPPVPRRLFE